MPLPQKDQHGPEKIVDTHVVVVILYSLSREVEHGPRNNTLTDEVADFKVGGQNGLRVVVLEKSRRFIHALPVLKLHDA